MRFLTFVVGLLLFFSPGFTESKKPLPSKRAVVVVTPAKRKHKRMLRVRHRLHQVHPLVILDAGHGGRDRGAKVHTVLEKRLALTTALYLKRSLENLGYRVIMTRSRDVYLSLKRRVNIANKMDGTLFVSLHFNSAENEKAHGVEVYYYPSKKDKARAKESKHLANCVLYKIVEETAMASRGVKTGNLHVVRETDMPAILIEGGFMTHSKEFSNLKNKDFLAKLANGVARGIDKYLKS